MVRFASSAPAFVSDARLLRFQHRSEASPTDHVSAARPADGPRAARLAPVARITGLSIADVRGRRERGEVNTLPNDTGRSLWRILQANLFTLFNAIVGGSFLLLLVLGYWQDALFGVFVIANVAIGVAQEFRAKVTLSRLAVLNAPRARVLRRASDDHDAEVEEIAKEGGGFSVKLKGGGTIGADAVMYATGRAPNTARMGLEEAGVALNEKSAVKVDEFSRSSVDNIYAIGDVTERMNLTPVAIAEAEAMVRTAFGGAPTAVEYSGVPSAVFSQPPIGTVGLTEAGAEARANGDGPIDVYVSRFTPMKYTLSGRDEKTMMKLIVERHTDRVLGCHMVGLDAPEIIQGFALGLRTGATKADFDATIGIHPTAGEEFFTLREKRG